MNFLIAVLYYFRQAGKLIADGNIKNVFGGNLDPFYLVSPLYFYENYKDKNKMKKILIIALSMVSLAIIQVVFNRDISIVKMIVNMVKIIICFTSMLYVIDNYKKIDILKITKITSILFAISIPVSLIFNKNDVLWRLNDIHNKYTLSRLNLFYLEPSELGFHLAILIIILLGYFLVSKDVKEKIFLTGLIITNSIVLYMARPLGAIVIVAFSICIMLLIDLIYRPTKAKFILYGIMSVCFIGLLIVLIQIKSPIIMRIIDTLNGRDASNSYRIGVTLDVFRQSFIDYKGLGCGFGNLNTDYFISKYNYLGLVVVVTNSFFYFVIETGIIGMVLLLAFLIIMLKRCLKDKSLIKWGLFSFLVFYQIFAGHFTSGLYWILYGIILSKFNENRLDRIKNI